MDWDIVIGIETHVQLKTKTKQFSGASTSFGNEPNSQGCLVSLAYPGVLPVLNQEAVNCAIKFGLSIDAIINRKSIFARKNYFYPDLPKGYQISQFELPIVGEGKLSILIDNHTKDVRILRAHLEEDAGKSSHGLSHGKSGIDLNRAGTPLLEIVTEPDMSSAEEAVAYAKKLHDLVQWIGICDGNMQEGNFRCDVNVSVKKKGSDVLGTRREIKNLNSFKSVQKAINYEYKKQIKLIESGQKIEQSTLSWDEKNNKTKIIRQKEDAHDYRYFPEPDLPKLSLSNKDLNDIKENLPELPNEKLDRFLKVYDIKEQDLNIITSDLELADYFESLVKLTKLHQATANWILVELLRYTKEKNITVKEFNVNQSRVSELIILYNDGKLTNTNAKKIFNLMINTNKTASELMIEEGLMIIDDDDFIKNAVKNVFDKNPNEFDRLKNGESKLVGFFMGQVMKEVKGKANPKSIQELINKYIGD